LGNGPRQHGPSETGANARCTVPESNTSPVITTVLRSFTDLAGELETRRGRSAWHRASAAQAEGAPDQVGGADFERARQRALSTFTSLLSGTADPRRAPLLERVFALGTLPVKLSVVKALAVADTARAAVKAHELAALCSADVGRELARIGDSLARAAHVS
jgi:hypothetical protein